MSSKAASSGGQAVVGDVSASPHGDIGAAGIIGNGATGNVIIHHLHINDGKHRATHPVVIPEGSISEAQACRLKELVAEWVVTHNQVKPRSPLTHQAAWTKLNRRIKVATYRATPASDFDDQEKWLLKQAAIIRSMASASGKDDTWRADRIKAIKTRASRNLGDANIYKPYIKRTFGADSLTDLANDELQRTYNWVYSKKKAESR